MRWCTLMKMELKKGFNTISRCVWKWKMSKVWVKHTINFKWKIEFTYISINCVLANTRVMRPSVVQTTVDLRMHGKSMWSVAGFRLVANQFRTIHWLRVTQVDITATDTFLLSVLWVWQNACGGELPLFGAMTHRSRSQGYNQFIDCPNRLSSDWFLLPIFAEHFENIFCAERFSFNCWKRIQIILICDDAFCTYTGIIVVELTLFIFVAGVKMSIADVYSQFGINYKWFFFFNYLYTVHLQLRMYVRIEWITFIIRCQYMYLHWNVKVTVERLFEKKKKKLRLLTVQHGNNYQFYVQMNAPNQLCWSTFFAKTLAKSWNSMFEFVAICWWEIRLQWGRHNSCMTITAISPYPRKS